eukprot:1157890-Pelagomonas_calceolata.AAC.1
MDPMQCHMQIKLLKVMALLGAGDRVASENMYAVIQQLSCTAADHCAGVPFAGESKSWSVCRQTH